MLFLTTSASVLSFFSPVVAAALLVRFNVCYSSQSALLVSSNQSTRCPGYIHATRVFTLLTEVSSHRARLNYGTMPYFRSPAALFGWQYLAPVMFVSSVVQVVVGRSRDIQPSFFHSVR